MHRRLKNYVGAAAGAAAGAVTSAPAWLASKAAPVAADGAGLLRSAAADAADRVSLFRRGNAQYDELEEEDDRPPPGHGSASALNGPAPRGSSASARVVRQALLSKGYVSASNTANEPLPSRAGAQPCSP